MLCLNFVVLFRYMWSRIKTNMAWFPYCLFLSLLVFLCIRKQRSTNGNMTKNADNKEEVLVDII